jgi:hypothetical protein
MFVRANKRLQGAIKFSAHGLKSCTLPLLIGLFITVIGADKVQAREPDCEQLLLPGADAAKSRLRRRPGSPSPSDCEALPTPGTETGIEATDGSAAAETGARAIYRHKRPESSVPRVSAKDYDDHVPLPDRWRIVDGLGYQERWYDPYNRNILKADRPVHDDWFFNVGLISDTVYESREVPTPVGVQSANSSGNLDVLGGFEQSLLNQNLAVELVYYKGDTVFKPPDYEFRFTPVFNYNRTELDEILGVNVNPNDGTTRNDNHVGIQAAFADIHLRNVSDRYDFDSVRIGIQPFSSDFRGFLFQDNQLGIRFFGTRKNNLYQYNIGWVRRLEKDTNSGLNDISQSLRNDDLVFANIYRQDFPVLGFTSQATLTYNRNREKDDIYFDNNGFIARPASLGVEIPRSYDVSYIGYNGDGHFGRVNLTTSLYYAFGDETTGTFTDKSSDISSFFAAAEVSMDFSWLRVRGSVLYGSGDDDPFDDESNGFDAIFENPQFAGSDTSYWVRQAVPLIGGGRVSLSSRNGVLNSMRSSKELGQSNFTNPGITLFGTGVDMDLTPETRLSFNVNQLWFNETAVLETARNQADISKSIGIDVSASIIHRPFMTQNIVLRISYATLIPGSGYKDLYGDKSAHSLLANIIFTY